jgi:hypothetical protein
MKMRILLLLVTFLLAGRAHAAAAQPWWLAEPTWWESNTNLLLKRVEESPRMKLEFSDLVIEPTGESTQFGFISSIAVGAEGNLYLLQRNLERDPVVVINSQGKVVGEWGIDRYVIPHSIRVDAQGNVWTVDSGNSQIYKYSPDGETLLHIDVGEMPEAPQPFTGTSDIAFASNGDIYVADGYGNSRILIYSAVGERKGQWGSLGQQDGQFSLVHGIAIDDDDYVYVADRENGRIQKFDLSGQHLATWDGFGRIFSLQVVGKVLWAVMSRLDQSNSAAGWLARVDPETGEIIGVVTTPGAHSVAVRDGCRVAIGAGAGRLIVYKPWPRHSCTSLID